MYIFSFCFFEVSFHGFYQIGIFLKPFHIAQLGNGFIFAINQQVQTTENLQIAEIKLNIKG